MHSININRMILDKLEERDLPAHVKGFIREILQHEKGRLDQQNPHYSRAYKNLLNKYALQSSATNDPD